jgi:hypothetical protein
MERRDLFRLTAAGLSARRKHRSARRLRALPGDNLTIGIAYIGDWLADRLETKRRA